MMQNSRFLLFAPKNPPRSLQDALPAASGSRSTGTAHAPRIPRFTLPHEGLILSHNFCWRRRMSSSARFSSFLRLRGKVGMGVNEQA